MLAIHCCHELSSESFPSQTFCQLSEQVEKCHKADTIIQVFLHALMVI